MQNEPADLRFFAVLTQAGSLAEAARRMDITPSAVSQRLRQMEQRLGLQLVHRSTRRFSLTDEGELFYTGAMTLLGQFDQLTEDLRARSGEVAGRLDVWGPLGFGRHHLAPLMAGFHTRHPKLLVTLTLTDVIHASQAQRFDLIVHIGHLADSSRVAYPIAPNARLLCASPDYLRHRPAPNTPDELATHDCIVLRENDEDVTLWRLRRGGKEVSVRVRPMLSSNDGEVVKQWALLGKGVMVRSEWDVADDLRAGRLVRVLPAWELPSADVVALVDQRTGMSARVRLFLEALQAQFRPLPPWRRTP